MNTILITASIFGFVLTSLLFLKKSTNSRAAFFLGSFYFIISMYALQTYLVDTDRLIQFSWFFIWPLLVYHLIFIFVYFYFVTVINDEFHWQNAYLLLFIPFFLGLVDVIYVYAAPNEVYSQLLNETIAHSENRFKAEYWLLSLNEHYLLRHLWQLFSLLMILPQLLRFLKEGTSHKLKKILNKWLLFFWTVQLLMASFTVLHGLDNFMDKSLLGSLFGLENGSELLIFLLYIIVFIIGVIPIYFPSLLHGFPRSKRKLNAVTEIKNDSVESMEETTADLKFGLSEINIKSKLDLIIENKVFLEQNFNVSKCAQEMELPAHHLSYFINETYGQNFTAFKNELRMDHARLLISHGFLEHNTMEALAEKCGFANRSSFSKTFKAITNQSPSEYVRDLQKR